MESCLLVMDVQPGILNRLENKDKYLESLKETIKRARDSKIKIIFVVVGFRDGMPEVSQNNKSFSAIKDAPSPGIINPQPAIKLEPNDIVVTKRRVSAFSGSDLEVLLRAGSINHLVLTGIATSGVVLSTLREAADKDYKITVLSDLCADFDQEVHRVLVEKVFPRQAEVLTARDWLN